VAAAKTKSTSSPLDYRIKAEARGKEKFLSKIVCPCGHIIVDQSDNLPNKAQFFADEDYDASYEQFILFCVDLIQARQDGKQEQFVALQFGPEYPKNLDLSDIISDKLAGMRAVFGHLMYECEQCGRLLIFSVVGKNKFISYFPEGEIRGILRSDSEKE
jgi:hypothetical protein